MKKLFLVFMLSAVMSSVITVSQAAPVMVHVGVHIADPVGPYPFPRGPVLLPNVYIDDHTLLFEDLCGEYVLQIIQNDNVVYSTLVSNGETSVILPSTLTGDYEFRLVADTYYYYGYIEL
jgi:hypothetical protein